MNLQKLKNDIITKSETTYEKVSYIAKVERFIGVILTFTPIILYLRDFSFHREFRDSISNYAYMCDSYWFGSLLALAGALFIFNGAQHMGVQKDTYLATIESRFGKGYNIIFGLALFGVIYFDHENHSTIHYIFAAIFFVGCALAMILTKETSLKRLGDILGWSTLLSLGIHFLLDYTLGADKNLFTLLWAEWVGLVLIAAYFIAESINRDQREKHAGMAPM